jgi:hypothetical protein
LGNKKERDHLEDLGIDESIEVDLKGMDMRLCTGLKWLRIGSNDGLL